MVQHGTYLAGTIRVLVLTVPITRSTYVRLLSDRTARGQYYVIGRFLVFTRLFVSRQQEILPHL